MIREAMMDRNDGGDDPIKWRGGEVSRVEALTDGMFAFAMTLLVVSLEVPKSYAQLMEGMKGFFSFLLCFAMMMWVWHSHYVFFRRYGLNDGPTITLNSILVFVVLFFVFPLKFLANALVAFVNHLLGYKGGFEIGISELANIFVLYGIGYIAIFLSFAALYANAWRRWELVGLTELERQITRAMALRYVAIAAIGLLSIVLALTTKNPMIAGPCYALVGFVESFYGAKFRRLQEQAAVR